MFVSYDVYFVNNVCEIKNILINVDKITTTTTNNNNNNDNAKANNTT